VAVHAAQISYTERMGRGLDTRGLGNCLDTRIGTRARSDLDFAAIPFVRLVMLSLRVLVLPLVMAAVLLLALAPASTASGSIETVDSYVVVAGDSLWKIAATATGAGADVRETIDQIEELNGLSSGTLQPGQVLLVPSSN